MLGNNFGLLGSYKSAKRLLKSIHRITSAEARIIAGTRNPEKTTNPHHLAYQSWNQERGRMRGQIRMRVRYERTIGTEAFVLTNIGRTQVYESSSEHGVAAD